MPLPTFLSGPGTPGVVVCQCTIVFAAPKNGWSETYYIHCDGGTTPLAAAANRMATICVARKAALSNSYAIEAIRISDVNVRGDSKLGLDPLDGAGFGTVVGSAASPVLGWWMKLDDSSRTIHETRIYRGWAAADIPYNELDPRSQQPPARPLGFLQFLANELVSTRTIFGSTTRFCLSAHARPGMPGVVQINGMGVGTVDGRLTFTASLPSPAGFVPGAQMVVTAPRVACVRGVSGTHRIFKVTPIGVGQVEYQTTTIYRCDPANLVLVVASAIIKQIGFVQVAFSTIGGQGKRDTGRRFFVSRGRAPTRP